MKLLLQDCGLKAVESAILGKSGVIGHDEDTPDLELRCCSMRARTHTTTHAHSAETSRDRYVP